MIEWYYESNGAQQGPVDTPRLLSLLNQGTLTASNLVWNSSMNGWMAVGQVPSLQTGVASLPVISSNPYSPPVSVAPVAPSYAGLSRFPWVKRANYPLMALLYLLGGVAFAVGIILLSGAPDAALFATLAISSGLGMIIAGYVLALIYLYRAWLVIQPYTTYSTPGRAVGFLFIPFFSIYWQFIAYWRWTQEWNRLVADTREGVNQGAPRANGALALTYAILQAVTLVAGAFATIPAGIIFLILMCQVCNAVNYAADRPA